MASQRGKHFGVRDVLEVVMVLADERVAEGRRHEKRDGKSGSL